MGTFKEFVVEQHKIHISGKPATDQEKKEFDRVVNYYDGKRGGDT